jgi:hypothetical protein
VEFLAVHLQGAVGDYLRHGERELRGARGEGLRGAAAANG